MLFTLSSCVFIEKQQTMFILVCECDVLYINIFWYYCQRNIYSLDSPPVASNWSQCDGSAGGRLKRVWKW